MTEQVHPDHVHPRSKRTAEPKPYRRLFKPVKPVEESNARAAETYRGARLNAIRGQRKSLTLKQERISRGISRSDLDDERERERRKSLLA